jgi:hypothetical protein
MTNIVNSCNIEQPNPRRVVLNLLRVAGGGVLAAPEALKAGALFGISENSMRVTLARLSRAGLVEAAERGLYRLGPAGSAIAADVGGWRDVESRLVPWRGRWVAAATGGLPRSDRRSLRIRTRALSMLGMRELEHGLFLRPDNLSGGVAGVRARLAGLGLEEGAAVFAIDDLDAARQAAAMALWASLGASASPRHRCTRKLSPRRRRHPPHRLRSAPARAAGRRAGAQRLHRRRHPLRRSRPPHLGRFSQPGVSGAPPSSRKPERSEGYPGPIGRGIVGRGPVLAMVPQRELMTRPCCSMGPGSAVASLPWPG